jgi:hypothetical protein
MDAASPSQSPKPGLKTVMIPAACSLLISLNLAPAFLSSGDNPNT